MKPQKKRKEYININPSNDFNYALIIPNNSQYGFFRLNQWNEIKNKSHQEILKIFKKAKVCFDSEELTLKNQIQFIEKTAKAHFTDETGNFKIVRIFGKTKNIQNFVFVIFQKYSVSSQFSWFDIELTSQNNKIEISKMVPENYRLGFFDNNILLILTYLAFEGKIFFDSDDYLLNHFEVELKERLLQKKECHHFKSKFRSFLQNLVSSQIPHQINQKMSIIL